MHRSIFQKRQQRHKNTKLQQTLSSCTRPNTVNGLRNWNTRGNNNTHAASCGFRGAVLGSVEYDSLKLHFKGEKFAFLHFL